MSKESEANAFETIARNVARCNEYRATGQCNGQCNGKCTEARVGDVPGGIGHKGVEVEPKGNESMSVEELKSISEFLERRILEGTKAMQYCLQFCRVAEAVKFKKGEAAEAATAIADTAIAFNRSREIGLEVEEDSAMLKRYTSVLSQLRGMMHGDEHGKQESGANLERTFRSGTGPRSLLGFLDIQIQDKARTILRLLGNATGPAAVDRYIVFLEGLPSEWELPDGSRTPLRGIYFDYVQAQDKLKVTSAITDLQGILAECRDKGTELAAAEAKPAVTTAMGNPGI